MVYASQKKDRKLRNIYSSDWKISNPTTSDNPKSSPEKKEDKWDTHQFIVPWQMH